MAATTQLTTFTDLYTDLQQRVRVQTGVTATENQAKRYINIALQDMHVGFGEQFPWAERRADLVTNQKYTTGTIAATVGSTTITGTSTAWNTANDFGLNNMRVGGKIVINGGFDVHEITAVGSDTSATLKTQFVQATMTGKDYVYFEDEFALDAGFLRPIDLTYFDRNEDIPLMSRTEFRRAYPRNKTPGKIKVATIIDLAFASDTTPVRKLRVHQPPENASIIPYSFVTSNLAVTSSGVEGENLSGDTDEPIIPLQYRHVLVFHALYHWYRDKKNDKRRAEAKSEYIDLMTRITGNPEIASVRPRIEMRVSRYVRRARSPYRRGRSGYHELGTAFDELRDR